MYPLTLLLFCMLRRSLRALTVLLAWACTEDRLGMVRY